MTLFPVYEVGSLPKLNARVRLLKDEPLTEQDIQQLNWYAKFSGTDPARLLSLQNRILSSEEKREIIDWNALANLRVQEACGLDVVYDGEARRSEMYRHVARQIIGFEDLPEMIRCRGPDSWRKSVCVSEPHIKNSEDIVKEFTYVTAHAHKPMKVPIDEPTMIANMTDNKFYTHLARMLCPDEPRKARYHAKREFTLALARYVIRPQVEAVIAAGARWVQLDAPAATLDLEHIPIFVEGINEVVRGLDAKFSIHLCYPRRITPIHKKGYEMLFPHVLNLDSRVNHFSLELANAEDYENDLHPFVRCGRKFEIGVGVVDITLERQQSGTIEKPETVRQRIAAALNVLKDPALVYVAPDCGLRQLTLERAIRLYEVMVLGTELARRG